MAKLLLGGAETAYLIHVVCFPWNGMGCPIRENVVLWFFHTLKTFLCCQHLFFSGMLVKYKKHTRKVMNMFVGALSVSIPFLAMAVYTLFTFCTLLHFQWSSVFFFASGQRSQEIVFQTIYALDKLFLFWVLLLLRLHVIGKHSQLRIEKVWHFVTGLHCSGFV